MTTNHPAHGPVSLDRLHQIREILSKAAAQSDGGNLGYAMADAVKVIDGAIAAFGVEPVAWLRESAITDIREGSWTPIIQMESQRMGVDLSESWGVNYIPLYTSQPAPVAMKDHQIRELVNDLRDIAVDYHGTQQLRERIARTVRAAMLQSFGNVEQLDTAPARLVNTIDETLIEALRLVQCMLDDYRERNYGHAQEWIRHISAKMDDYSEQHGDDAYSVISAAMLQAGNSQVTPDGWIPVSERMPDKLIPVMVMYADGEMWSAMWSGQFWDDGCTIPDPHAITHWREMPAAPQQEVK
ncbi:DUF551 domain-containing protein [Citrobacter sp. Cf224]|uniref:DUF551 domain-containing protein n=1 Tax=Citrobacter sp. Cf224 TaxID=2985087 RepID=UPI002574FA6B|nr:DUF551 domain-containing protein [Citrobacter sp. Cf224]MDM3071463.1 DUF551 domain-containing protein [Citrobacter sp. Cf224]